MSHRIPVLAAVIWVIVTGGNARAQDGAPGQAPGEAPAPAPGGAPGQVPGEAPVPVQDGAPGQVPGEAPAPAQGGAPEETLGEELARGIVRSVRRAVAFGPTVGAFSAYAPSASELDTGMSFGLELELFRLSVPTPARIREIARAKTQEHLIRIIRDRFGGQRPDPATLEQLVREIAAEVKAEVLAALGAQPRLLERPRLGIYAEAGYFFGPADWLGRLGFRLGAGPVSLGPTFSVRFGDDTVARLGAELSVHLLPSGSPRSPVLDVFLRGDFELHARDANDDQISVGVRLLLDLI